MQAINQADHETPKPQNTNPTRARISIIIDFTTPAHRNRRQRAGDSRKAHKQHEAQRHSHFPPQQALLTSRNKNQADNRKRDFERGGERQRMRRRDEEERDGEDEEREVEGKEVD